MSTHPRAIVTVTPREIRVAGDSIALRGGGPSDGGLVESVVERLRAISGELLEVEVDPEIPFRTLADVLFAAARAGRGTRGVWLRDTSDSRAHPIVLPPFAMPEREVSGGVALSAAQAAYASARVLITVAERGIAWNLADARTGPVTLPNESNGEHLEQLARQLTNLKCEQPAWDRVWLLPFPEVRVRAVAQVIAVARGAETSPRFAEVVVSTPHLVSFTSSP